MRCFNHQYVTLGLLFLVNIFNFADRLALAVLVEPIKEDLLLSDTQIGLLSGFAFAVIYCTIGFPVARWADIGVRRNIVAISLAVWSAMTLVCGFAMNFWQFALARVGVGLGEAGGTPPAHSLISDTFSQSRRGTAMAIFTAGGAVGAAFGSMAAGWLADGYGWRVAFISLGLPGLILALTIRVAMSEPDRGGTDSLSHTASVAPWGDVLRAFRSNATLRSLLWGASALAFLFYGINQWSAAFFMRSHGLSATDVGLYLGIGGGFGGIAGTILGGLLSDRLGSRDPRWAPWLMVMTTLLSLPLTLLGFVTDSMPTAMAAYLVGSAILSGATAPLMAQVQTVVAVRERAMASATLMAMLSLIGLGASGLLIGVVSDMLQPIYGQDSLRHALVLALPTGLVASWYFWRAAQTQGADTCEALRRSAWPGSTCDGAGPTLTRRPSKEDR